MRKILQSSLLLLVVLRVRPGGQARRPGRPPTAAAPSASVLALLNDIRHEHGLARFVGEHRAPRCGSRALLATCSRAGTSSTTAPRSPSTSASAASSKSPLVGENIAWGTGKYALGRRASSACGCTRRRIAGSSSCPSLRRVGLGVATGSFQGNRGRRHGNRRLLLLTGPRPSESTSSMNSPQSPIHAAVTRARIERVIARLPRALGGAPRGHRGDAVRVRRAACRPATAARAATARISSAARHAGARSPRPQNRVGILRSV